MSKTLPLLILAVLGPFVAVTAYVLAYRRFDGILIFVAAASGACCLPVPPGPAERALIWRGVFSLAMELGLVGYAYLLTAFVLGLEQAKSPILAARNS